MNIDKVNKLADQWEKIAMVRNDTTLNGHTMYTNGPGSEQWVNEQDITPEEKLALLELIEGSDED